MKSTNDNVEQTGLAEAEASLRLQQHGYNELPSSKSRNILTTAWEVVREPMFLLLLACGTIYLALNWRSWTKRNCNGGYKPSTCSLAWCRNKSCDW